MKDFIKVGTTASEYNEVRNIISLPFKNAKVVRRYDLMNLVHYVYFKMYRKPKYQFLHRDFGLNDVDLFHFFDKLSFSNTPWITTFETRIPYYHPDKTPDSYYKPIASKHCKRLIAMSQRAHNIELFLLEKRKQYKEAIEKKIVVIHPAQKQLVNDYSEKNLEKDSITFSFIGTAFFRKGGMEVLKVFDRVFADHKNIKLTIVSSLEHGDYVSRSTLDDVKNAISIINKHPYQIKHFNKLENSKVLELIRNSHINLLPSYHDSYGYSILEAQSCGSPVISTDICAMTEINNEQCGWVLNIPKDDLKDGYWRTEEDRKKLSSVLQEQLYATVIDIINNPEQVKIKGINAMKRIAIEHAPETAAEKIENIYREALSK